MIVSDPNCRIHSAIKLGYVVKCAENTYNPFSMNISYPSHSKFVTACEDAIAAHGSQVGSRIEVHLGLGGYSRSVSVTISLENTTHFGTDWQGSDPTRFPARIRAAAAALFQQGVSGSFQISHQGGVLSIKSTESESRGEGWSHPELKASVEAYVDMLQKYHAGQTTVKKAYYNDLAQRFGRTGKRLSSACRTSPTFIPCWDGSGFPD